MKDFVPNDLYIQLKEIGFEHTQVYVMGFSSKAIFEPLFSQAFRWFREKHGLHAIIVPSDLKIGKWYYHRFDLNNLNRESEPELVDKFDTPEQAETECLRKLIEITKTK